MKQNPGIIEIFGCEECFMSSVESFVCNVHMQTHTRPPSLHMTASFLPVLPFGLCTSFRKAFPLGHPSPIILLYHHVFFHYSWLPLSELITYYSCHFFLLPTLFLLPYLSRSLEGRDSAYFI